jgi:nitrite reductase/ring-hydroxylating ferredoxin subunit
MKTIKLLLTTTFAVIVLSSAAFALPAWKGGPADPAMTKGDFETLKTGDKIVLVCKASDSITVIDIKDKKMALALCKEGRMVHCPLCKKDYKLIWGNPTGKAGGPETKVTMVNEKGEPCMFFAKVSK